MLVLLILVSWAGLYENVTFNREYYNGEIFNPSLMYNTTSFLEYKTYITLDELENRKRSLFNHLLEGKQYIERCYSNYEMIEAICNTNSIILYFLSFSDQDRMRELMSYNNILRNGVGVEVVERVETREDPETNTTHTTYSYHWRVVQNNSLYCYTLLFLPASLINIIFEILVAADALNTCKIASTYYNRFLIDLSYILEYQNNKINHIYEKLNYTYDQFQSNGGCTIYSGICARYINVSKELENIRNVYLDVIQVPERHSVYVVRSTNLYRIAQELQVTLDELINNTRSENERLLVELSRINLTSYCLDQDLTYVDYYFDDGSPAQNCYRASLLLSLISNINLEDSRVFYLNQRLKKLKNDINEYLRLDKDAINKARIAVDALRKVKTMELERMKYDSNTKRMLMNNIQSDKDTIGKTYVFLKNLRYEDYRDYNSLYQRILNLIRLAEKDDIDVSYEKILLNNVVQFNQEELYMVEENIYWKAKNRYGHLLELRANLIEMLNRLPLSVAREFRNELLRLEGPEGLVIDRSIGRLKSIEKAYLDMISKIETKVADYLKGQLEISYHVTYPDKFYVDRQETVSLLVKICNPFDITFKDIKIEPNRLMKAFSMGSINIDTLYPNSCQFYEAWTKQVLARSRLVNLEARLIDNNLTTKHRLTIESQIDGVAIYNYKEYNVKEGLNEFDFINNTIVPLYVRNIGNGSIILEWRYGEFPIILVKYAGLEPCKINKHYYEFCNTSLNRLIELFNTTNTTEIIRKVEIELEKIELNRTLSYLNSTIPTSLNISINASGKNIIENVERQIRDMATKIYNSIKNAFKTSEAKTYINLLYHRATTGNRSALQELIRIQENLGNTNINTTIVDKYEADYIKEYFDLDPRKVRTELDAIKEMMVYDPERATEKYEQLKASILSQYDLAKERVMMFTQKYGDEDRAKIEKMLEQGRVKEAINYMKNLKPVQQNNKTVGTDMRLYALAFLLLLIGGLGYYMLRKRSNQEFKTLQDSDDKD